MWQGMYIIWSLNHSHKYIWDPRLVTTVPADALAPPISMLIDNYKDMFPSEFLVKLMILLNYLKQDDGNKNGPPDHIKSCSTHSIP